MIRLELAKGVWLILPVEQYRQGLRRGKAFRRAQRLAARLTRQAEATRPDLAWVTPTLQGPRLAKKEE
jgi:hypothetical protein